MNEQRAKDRAQMIVCATAHSNLRKDEGKCNKTELQARKLLRALMREQLEYELAQDGADANK